MDRRSSPMRGVEVAIVLSMDAEYRKMITRRRNSHDFFRESPLVGKRPRYWIVIRVIFEEQIAL